LKKENIVEKIKLIRYSMSDKIILKGVLQKFDYPSNGRIYDGKIYHKSLRKFLRKIKIMSIFHER
jgi:hypothetical protein